MNYTWEATLAANRVGIPREKITYKPMKNGSPYAEVVLENLNSKGIENSQIEVNPLYRFAREFSSLFDINIKEYEQTKELLVDIVMRTLL